MQLFPFFLGEGGGVLQPLQLLGSNSAISIHWTKSQSQKRAQAQP